MDQDFFWQTKLHARLHDPAEKALVLLRDPEGHEGGTSKALHRTLGFDRLPVREWLPPDNPGVLDTVLFRKGIPITMYDLVKRADRWAAAADRPQWPHEEVEARIRVAPWAQVRWFNDPELIHPLTGKSLDLSTLANTDLADLKRRSLEHFKALTVYGDDSKSEVDWQKTLLAFWRFGPELGEEHDHGKLGMLWSLLPADTRVPDHSIWDHLDLTSAFAGAFACDPNQQASLLSLSIGPVQSFIETARTISDLWAGSHLLSRLSWEAMRVVCERLGPDAVLFPRLRGLPQVDLWLRDQMKLPKELFARCQWTEKKTDSNPLFAAALPNRFVAVVPEAEANDLAHQIGETIRNWLQEKGKTVLHRLLKEAGFRQDPAMHCFRQMSEQLDGFPEVHWAAASFSLIHQDNDVPSAGLDTKKLAAAMQPFFSAEGKNPKAPGFLGSKAWEVLEKNVDLENNLAFFSPNPGVLYPALHEICERALSAAKSVRPFSQTEQAGWRCSLTGETEWLTTDPGQLGRSFRQQSDTLWSRVAEKRPAWVKKHEHLGALSAVKRLWPILFAEEVGEATGEEVGRFVVSTHTMSLAGNLEMLSNKMTEDPKIAGRLSTFIKDEDRAPALPPALAGLRDTDAARIPAVLDRLRQEDGGEDRLRKLEQQLQEILGYKPDTYYALLLFDGDHMGRILAGDDDYAITYRESFHSRVRVGFDRLAQKDSRVGDYGALKRAISPNRHFAISSSLNDFALHAVPEIVEREHCGRVIYAGGDDVLAMLPVGHLLSTMQRLCKVYRGEADDHQLIDWKSARSGQKIVCKDGFALLPRNPGRLMRMMGGATASCGAVIAHHQSPLGAVLRELRQAEKRAKNEGGRNAFTLRVLKRSGGALSLTGKWDKTVGVLEKIRDFLSHRSVSRRAVYNSLTWLRDLPDKADEKMVGDLLYYQLSRQTADKAVGGQYNLSELTHTVGKLAVDGSSSWRQWLEDFLSVAEFLAREVRAYDPIATSSSQGAK